MTDPTSGVAVAEKDEATTTSTKSQKRMSRRQLVFRRFLRNKPAVVGLVVLALLGLIALVGPLLAPWGWEEIDDAAFLQKPGLRHFFGSTQAGRDVFALTLHGMRKSLLVGLLVALISTSVAAIVGSFIAYYGGWVQRIGLWMIDLLLVIPSFLIIAILMSQIDTGLAAKLGLSGYNSWIVLVFLLAAFGWVLSARVVRSVTLSVKEREYVHAARFMGLSGPTVIVRHILPNISSLLIIDATLNVSGAILGETFLSFFGFGIQPPDVSLGTLIADGQTQVTSFPWLFIPPAAVLVILVLSVNAVGDGLRDALDPNSQAGGSAK